MAFASDSTTAPARPLLPVRDARGRFVKCDTLSYFGANELLAEIAAEIERQGGVPNSGHTPTGLPKSGETPELPPEPLLAARCNSAPNDFSGLAHSPQGVTGGSRVHTPTRHDTVMPDRCLTPTVRAIVAQTPELGCFDIATPWPGDTHNLSGAQVMAEPDTASAARTLHLRRQLEAAAEHGIALLSALGLPRLVGPDFSRTDIGTVGDALDLAIATLNALDGDTDTEDGGDDEPSLGWRTSAAGVTSPAGTDDREQDTADDEPSLASPERHPTASHWTAPWSWVDTGPDSSQLRWAEGAQHDGEKVDEDGPIDEDELDGSGEASGHHDAEPSIGWPEDFTAEVAPTLEAGADAEHDDVDREDDDRDPVPVAWVFGPSRREVAHV